MNDVAQHLQAAERHARKGRFREAEGSYREALAQVPSHATASAGLAEACRRQGRKSEALEALLHALPMEPKSVALTMGLGRLLEDLGEVEGAIGCFDRALQLEPASAEAKRLLAAARARRRGPALSGQLIDRLSANVQVMFARALVRLGRGAEAAPLYRSALHRDPHHVRARFELGHVLFGLGQIDATFEDALHAAVANDPKSAALRFDLGQAALQTGRLRQAIDAFEKAHELDPGEQGYLSCVAYACTLACDGPAALAAARRWSDRYEKPGLPAPAPAARSRDRLRVGYLSPDFYHHVDSYFLLPLLRHHDRARFEVSCYSATRRPDRVTATLAQHADRWVSIAALNDEQAAARIREDGVDILVDLKLHSSDHRLGVFARRPAPVQVCWLSYPGTTGLRAMDFRLTDPHLDPPGSDASHYSERSIRLADTFWCYERSEPSPPVAPPPMLARGHATFGSLNRVTKVSDAVLELWARLLGRVGGARLIVHAQPGRATTRIMDALTSRGVTADRIEVVGHQANDEYLETYHRIDVVLDTYPYGGGTTTLDALWMGVPVVTLVGPTAGGRAGLSLATNLGHPELVATTGEGYVQLAAQLARDPARLTALRAGMRDRMRASPLMDAPRFAASVEAAYAAMWREKFAQT